MKNNIINVMNIFKNNNNRLILKILILSQNIKPITKIYSKCEFNILCLILLLYIFTYNHICNIYDK